MTADSNFPLPSGQGGAQRRMRERSRTIPGAANRSILPSSAFSTFSRREKGKKGKASGASFALREASAGEDPVEPSLLGWFFIVCGRRQ